MTISQFSMTISLLEFGIHDIMQKGRKMRNFLTDAKFLNVSKKGINLVKLSGKSSKTP